MSQVLIDTRQRGAGLLVELLDDRRLRVAIVVRYPTVGLYGYQEYLQPDQTHDLLARALLAMGLQIAAPGDVHATTSAEMHAAAPAGEDWNPFAPGPDLEDGP